MRIAWQDYDLAKTAAVSQARGYVTAQAGLLNALRRMLRSDLVVNLVGMDRPQPRVVVHFCPPHFLKPWPNRLNILFTMWEGDELIPEIIDGIRSADVCVVPSTYCARVWERSGFTAHVVPLGIHAGLLQRDPYRPGCDGRPLREEDIVRVLCLAAVNSRKGWDLVAPAWREAFENTRHQAQLYCKTIGDGKVHSVFGGHVMLDQRDLEVKELLELYESASLFLFPSYGEGFGLPALEAMAAGCLVVSTDAGGLADFVNHSTAVVIPRSIERDVTYGVRYRTWVPTVYDVARALRFAYDEWGTEEIEKRRRAGIQLARSFTWDNAVAQLVGVAAAADGRRHGLGLVG